MTSRTAVWFGALVPPPRRWEGLPTSAWTCVGGLAIPLWATWPALSLRTQEIPPLECLTIVFFVSWLVLRRIEPRLAARDSERPSGFSRGPSWIPALAFALGESGSAVFFLLATHFIAAAEANLIMYLWPVMVVGLGAALQIFRLRIRHVAGIASGLIGAAILTRGGGLTLSYWGLLLSFLGGISWALYCVFRLVWTRATGPLLARGFGLSTVLCGSLHLLLEPSVLPSVGGATAAMIVGIVPSAFANLAWDEGFRRGDSRLLAVMAYATPLCSTLLLVALGVESFTTSLFVAAFLIVVGGFLSRTNV